MNKINDYGAMILAAGLGSRLETITQNKPKALVEVNGKPLIEHVIDRIRETGIRSVVVNLHHQAEMIREFLSKPAFSDLEIAFSDETSELLDTGGALIGAYEHLRKHKAILVHNVDILTDADLNILLQTHQLNQHDITLLVGERNTTRKFLFDQHMQLKGWANVEKENYRIVENYSYQALIPFAFNGIHVMNPLLLSCRKASPCSLIDLYLELANYHLIKGVNLNYTFWFDVGKPDQLALANNWYKQKGS